MFGFQKEKEPTICDTIGLVNGSTICEIVTCLAKMWIQAAVALLLIVVAVYYYWFQQGPKVEERENSPSKQTKTPPIRKVTAYAEIRPMHAARQEEEENKAQNATRVRFGFFLSPWIFRRVRE